MPEPSNFQVFLDANVLAKPVTRSLLMFAALPSGYTVTWSAYVEAEADRHRRGHQASVASIRQVEGLEHSPSSTCSDVYATTSLHDRQVLADAVKAGAMFIVTEDVDDFGETDLTDSNVSAVNPDLFLAERVTTDTFRDAVARMAAPMTTPPRTPGELFAALGRQHPRTVAAHQAAFDVQPMLPTHNSPAALFRGHRCLRCLRSVDQLTLGVCIECRST